MPFFYDFNSEVPLTCIIGRRPSRPSSGLKAQAGGSERDQLADSSTVLLLMSIGTPTSAAAETAASSRPTVARMAVQQQACTLQSLPQY